MNKTELRREYLEIQKKLSAEERSSMSEQITDLFFSSFDLSKIGVLHCFLPIQKFNEIDTRLIFERLWREHPSIQTIVPRVDFETNEMVSLEFDRETALSRNAWDIEEPTHDRIVEPKEIDMVLVPGVCFDRRAHRVGYGKGYYDRFLKKCRYDCIRVGLSYFDPVDEIEDLHEGDVRLDAIVTSAREPAI